MSAVDNTTFSSSSPRHALPRLRRLLLSSRRRSDANLMDICPPGNQLHYFMVI
jgi:hypothetical protein